ncbi:retention module-containing protein, partial [Iodobacter sp. LRB]
MAEQTNTTKAHATIVHIDGKAYLRDESGKTVPLQPGQKIDEQQVLVTANDGHVQLQLPNGELVDIGPARTVQIDAQILNTAPADSATAAISDLAESTAKIAAAIANGQDLSTELEATATGLNGTGASEGHSFVQLLRIAEGVEPLAFNFGNNNFAATDLPVNPNTVQLGIQAVNDAVTLEEDGESRINVLGNDIGNNLKVNTAVANNGTVSINPDGTLSYKPNANFNGNDQITYTITDANGTSSTATVAVTVTPVNDLPQPTDSNGNPLTVPVQISTKEDTPIAGKVTATDPDGDTLTFTPKDQPTHGTVTVNPDGSYIYTPAPDYNGKDSFTVTVNDGKGGTAIITVNVTVDPVNDAPVGTNQTITTPEDTPITGKLVATDKDGDPLTFTAKDQPAHGTVTVKPDGSYEYTPAPDYNGKDSFTVTVNDGKGGTAVITVNVTVDPVNDAPVGTNQTITTPEDTPITGKLVATDKDGDPLTFTAKDQPVHGTVTVKPDGSYEYTPAPDYNGKDSFTVTVNDGKGGTAVITVNVTVDPVNDAPVGTNQAITTPEDTPITGKLVATDKDGDPLTFTAKDQPAHGTVTVKPDGSYEYTPAPDYNGKDSFTVTVSDGKGGTAVITVNVTVDPVNDAPIGTNQAITTPEDTPITGKLVATDKDGDPLTFTAKDQPAHGTVTVKPDGSYEYTPAPDYNGKDSFTVTVSDGKGGTAIITVDVGITPTDDPANISGNDQGTVQEDGVLIANGKLTVADKDAGQSEMKPQTVTNEYGTFSIAKDGTWSFTLDNAANEVQSLSDKDSLNKTYVVESLDGTKHDVVITINGKDDAAEITPSKPGDDAGQVKEDTVLTTSGTLLVNDKDAGQSSFQAQTDTNGTYGKFSIGTDGKWTYVLNNAAANVQALAEGETKTETFTVKSADGTTSSVVVAVVGTNDAAVITPNKPGDDAGSVKEDTTLTTSGTLLVNDKDAGQSSFQAQTDTDGAYGKFSIGTDGKWTYVLNNAAANVQALAEGETKTETFAVKSADGTTSSVVVTVVGTNDAAVITPNKPGDDAGQVKEDAVLSTGGTLLVNDKDAGQSSFQAQTDTDGTYGKFSIGTDGKWTYVLNNAAANVQALAEGETKTETFTVKSADGTTSSVVVTVVGTNDAATITPSKPGDDAGQVKEDTTLTTGGTLLVNDKDAGQSSFQAQTDTDGTYGKFSIGTDGKWTYVLNNAAANVQALAEGETKTETFTVKSADGTTSSVVVTVVGTNDAAVITPNKPGDDAGQVKEDTTLTTGGTLLVNDKDAGQSSFQAQTNTDGTYGKFSIGTDGKWTYTLNNNDPVVQALKDGDVKTETFTVKSADGTTSTITVTVNGTNESATVGHGAVQEDTVQSSTGTLTATGGATFVPQTDAAGTYGKLTLGSDGKWTYTLNNDADNVQALKTGETKTESFNVVLSDGTKTTITIDVQGLDDKAVITPSKPGDDAGQVKEDSVLTTSGTLLVNDKDAGQSSFQAQTNTDGTYGKFSIGTDGKWTYTLNNNDPVVQALKDGDVKTGTFTVKSADGTTSTITVTVNGTNESATVGHGAVQEDTVQSSSGTLTATGGATFVPQTDAAGTYGKLTLGSDGKWTYTLNNDADNVQALKSGETKTESFDVVLSDGTKTTITIDVQGLDDKAVITPSKPGDDAGQVKEDSVLTTSGTLLVNDKDAGQSSFQAQTNTDGTYGKFSIGTNGKWTYVLNNAAANVQALAEGETKTETFTVKSADGTTSSVVVTVVGTNDAAVITPNKPGDDAGQVKEDAVLSTGGTLLVNDKDAGQSSFQAQTNTDGTYGKFSIGTDGKWTYVLNNAAANVQALAEGETKTETFTVKSADGTTSSVVVTVVGTNDAAVITPNKPGDDAGQVKEDAVLTTSGTLLVNDKDAGQSSFQAQTDTNGTYGKFSIGTDGKWTYVLNNAAANVQALAEGETKTETFTVKSADGTTSSVVVTVVGTNDAAVITPNKPGDDAGQVKEDTVLTTSGTLLVNDKDAGQSSFQAQTDTNGTYGKFSIGTNGKWTYVLNNAAANVQALAEGETKTETFTVKSADGTTSSVVVTIVGTNDAAIITPSKPGDDAGQVKEDTTLTTSGTLMVNDKDASQSSFQAQTNTDGTYGKFSIGTDGKWTYALNNAAANVQALAEGETKTETFTVKSADGTTSSVVVTVVGTNDAAVITPNKPGDDAGQVKEDTILTTSGTLLVSDKDAGQSSFQAQSNTDGTYGKFSIGTDGKWTYTLNNNDPVVQALKDGDVKTETFTVKSADGTTSTITVTVNGTNESATVGHGAVQEDTVQSSTGTLSATGGATFVPQTNAAGTYGKLTLGSDGKWTYTLNNDADNVQALKTGETKTESFNVVLSDGTKTTITIDVQGLDDKAVIGQGQGDIGAGTVKEDTPAQTTASGHLTITDKDAGQASFTPQTVKNAYGTFTLQANGDWKFDIDNSSATVQA